MNIQLIRLQSGEQVLGEYDTITGIDGTFTLKNPVALVPTQDGNINFVPWPP